MTNSVTTRLARIAHLNEEATCIQSANALYWRDKVYTLNAVGSYQDRCDRLEEIRRELSTLRESPAWLERF